MFNVQTHEDMAHWGINWDRLEPYYRLTAGVKVRRVPVRDFDPDDLRRNLPRASKSWMNCCTGPHRLRPLQHGRQPLSQHCHCLPPLGSGVGLGEGNGSCDGMPVMRSVPGCDPVGEQGSGGKRSSHARVRHRDCHYGHLQRIVAGGVGNLHVGSPRERRTCTRAMIDSRASARSRWARRRLRPGSRGLAGSLGGVRDLQRAANGDG